MATLARQMELTIIHDDWKLFDCDRETTVKLANAFAEAIREILRYANLSDDWRVNLDAPDAFVPRKPEQ